MRKIDNIPGVSPELRNYLGYLENSILLGNITMTVSPATLGTAATAADFTRTVTVTLADSDSVTQEWINGTFATSAAIAETTAGDGAATIPSTTLTIKDGVGTVVVSCTGTWAENDTCTLTISALVIAGVSVTGGTSVDTIVA